MKIIESWNNIKKKLNQIKLQGEEVLIIGDLNRGVGNDNNGG